MTYYHLPGKDAEAQRIDNPVILKQLERQVFQIGDQITVGDLITIPLEVVEISENFIVFRWTK